MKIALMRRFLFFCTLKQGTTVIALFQMFTNIFTLVLFILAITHAIEIEGVVVMDADDALEREALKEISSNHINTKKMNAAHHHATETIYTLYYAFFVTIIHFVSALMLLYGTLTNNRHYMTPWMVITMIIIMYLFISLFVVSEECFFVISLGGAANAWERMVVFGIMLLHCYVWFTIYSHYKNLEPRKGLVHEVHEVHEMCNLGRHIVSTDVPPQVIPVSPKVIPVSQRKSYDV